MSLAVSVHVNGEKTVVAPGTTVAGLLASLEAGPRGIAVARNGEVVPRSEWDDAVLFEGDLVEVLAAAQGG